MIHEQLYKLDQEAVDEWFAAQYKHIEPLFYSSVDIRDSGYKIAPVDTNVFPAGFNNLQTHEYGHASKLIDQYLSRYKKSATVLIITENHTRNIYYTQNIDTLKILIEGTGREVEVCALQDFNSTDADIVVLNNDLSAGLNPRLVEAEQPIVPHYKFGWYNRSKYAHFQSYNNVVRSFAQQFGIDPFLISTEIDICRNLNFHTKEGLQELAQKVDEMIAKLSTSWPFSKFASASEVRGASERRTAAYPYVREDSKREVTQQIASQKVEFGKRPPYVFIKADKGTYGMGVISVTSGDQILNMNKNLRKKMHTIKDAIANTTVLIQEGVPTAQTFQGASAESMIYMIGGEPISSIMRVNESQNALDNLNRKEAFFRPFSGPDSLNKPHQLIARLASLAASLEGFGKNSA